MTNRLPLVATACLLAAGASAPGLVVRLEAQPRPQVVQMQDARATRESLREVLNEYPPALIQVLRLDPTLLTRADYLATYPALASFLAEHPDVARSPSFYLGEAPREDNARYRALSMMQDTMVGLLVFSGFVMALLSLGWLIRTGLADRRWQRLTKTQTEAHTKLLDRLTSNDELLAYIQSPAGKRFLEAAPTPLDEGARAPLNAPIARILWSVQAGVVLVAVGFGLFLARTHVLEEIGAAFDVMGIIVMALGVGFAASAFIAYVVSHRLGLLTPAAQHDA